jgi:uncharacterized protein
MSWPVLRASLDLLLKSRSRPLTIEFSGGEPLLEFAMIRRAVRYVERRRGTCEVQYALTTNGTLLDGESLRLLEDHDFQIELSYHAIPSAQDRRGRAIFRRLDETIDRLRGEYPRLWRQRVLVAVTLGIPEVPALADSISYLVSKGARHIVMSAAFGQEGWRLRDIDEIRRQFRRITALVENESARSGHVPLALYRREQDDSVVLGREPRWCSGAAGHAISIDPNGQAYGCAMLAGARPVIAEGMVGTAAARSMSSLSALIIDRGSPLWRFRLGDVRDPGFERRLGKCPSSVLDMFDERRQQRSSYRRCGDCRYIAECSICPVAHAFDPNRDPTRVSDFVCAFNQVAFETREKSLGVPSLQQRLAGHAPVPVLVRELRQYASAVRQARHLQPCSRPGAGWFTEP